MSEETEKSTAEILNDKDFKISLNFMSLEDVYISEMSQFGHITSSKIDDFGVEGNPEGYDNYEQEELVRFLAGKSFTDESMDLSYDQDFSQYPDGILS